MTAVEKKHPTQEAGLVEARLHFYEKIEQAVKLALSKFSRVHVGRTLFGKVHLEGQAACVACDRPFNDDPGEGKDFP